MLTNCFDGHLDRILPLGSVIFPTYGNPVLYARWLLCRWPNSLRFDTWPARAVWRFSCNSRSWNLGRSIFFDNCMLLSFRAANDRQIHLSLKALFQMEAYMWTAYLPIYFVTNLSFEVFYLFPGATSISDGLVSDGGWSPTLLDAHPSHPFLPGILLFFPPIHVFFHKHDAPSVTFCQFTKVGELGHFLLGATSRDMARWSSE